MKAVDAERFNESMAEEIDNIFKNEIHIIVKRSNVPSEKIIFRSGWSFKRKITLSGEIYRHISRLCAYVST